MQAPSARSFSDPKAKICQGAARLRQPRPEGPGHGRKSTYCRAFRSCDPAILPSACFNAVFDQHFQHFSIFRLTTPPTYGSL
jgi:hypothetical protein